MRLSPALPEKTDGQGKIGEPRQTRMLTIIGLVVGRVYAFHFSKLLGPEASGLGRERKKKGDTNANIDSRPSRRRRYKLPDVEAPAVTFSKDGRRRSLPSSLVACMVADLGSTHHIAQPELKRSLAASGQTWWPRPRGGEIDRALAQALE